MQLRPYQRDAKAAIKAQWAGGVRRTLLVLPTGCGKTVVFCKLAEDEVREGKRVLILAHRGELLEQAADKMEMVTGLRCAVEKAEDTAIDSFFRITIGSVQSLMRPDRLEQFDPDHYQIIIVDEAHHALADSYRRILEYFSNAKLLGVTATPDRGDRRNLGQFFDSIAYEYPLPQAIKDGFLCPIKALTIPLKIDLGTLSVQAGDFKLNELGDKLSPYLVQIAEHIKEHCENRKTMIFLPLIKTSQKMCEILNHYGISAVEVNGNSPDRSEIIQAFHRDQYNVLCNSMLLMEGYDEPAVDCIVCLRPTKIRSLYAQCIGRGTRIHPGKDDLLILDFLWHTERHELCRPAHLVSDSEKVTEKMIQKMTEETNVQMDISELELLVKDELIHERELALADKLKEMRHRKRKLVDPLQYEISILDQDLADYMPDFISDMAPVTAKQKEFLEKFGIYPDDIECKGKASMIIDRLIKRKELGLTTPRQIRLLENKGFLHVGQWSFADATRLIGEIADNGWRVPFDIIPEEYKPSYKQFEELNV